jgi:hypothetical protein
MASNMNDILFDKIKELINKAEIIIESIKYHEKEYLEYDFASSDIDKKVLCLCFDVNNTFNMISKLIKRLIKN